MPLITILQQYFFPPKNTTFRMLFREMDKRLGSLGLDFSTELKVRKSRKIRALLQIMPLFFGYYLCFKGILSTNIHDERFISYFVGTALSINIVPKFIHIYFFHAELYSLRSVVVRNTERYTNCLAIESELLKKYNRLTGIVSYAFIVIFTALCLFCCFGPFLFEKNDFPLPVYIDFPGLSNQQHPGYEISFILCAYHTYYAMKLVLGLDLCFYIIVLYIALRLDICQEMMVRIGDRSSEYSTDESQRKLIRDSLLLHIDITEFAKKFIGSFTMIMFYQIAASLVLMTTTMSSFENNFVLSFSVFVAYVMQFFLYCLFGELVVSKFKDTSTKLYCSKWYNIVDIKDRKLIWFFLMQSKRELTVSTYGLFELSLDTFTKVSKAAYGYYAFLQNVF